VPVRDAFIFAWSGSLDSGETVSTTGDVSSGCATIFELGDDEDDLGDAIANGNIWPCDGDSSEDD
jgi:hypothetical protein